MPKRSSNSYNNSAELIVASIGGRDISSNCGESSGQGSIMMGILVYRSFRPNLNTAKM